MAEFPTRPDEITPAWVEEALRASGALTRGKIAALTWQAIGTGQVGDSARFTITYASESDGPQTVAAKFTAADATSRATAAMFGLYRKEVMFYGAAAPLLDVRVPQVFASHLSKDGEEFILLFEDLGPARGGNQLDSCGIADARHAIRQAAATHAPSWGRTEIIEAEWHKPPPDIGVRIAALYPQAQAVWRERYAEALESQYMQICELLAECGAIWFERNQPPQCLVHGDFRLDNMLFDIRGGAEPIAILDWQTVTAGNAMTDIGYFLGCGIGDGLRRGHENELLDLYCEDMTARGVPLTRDAIWDDYRIGALHGLSTAVFSAAFVERTERGDANFLSMARGACALALEHDSIGALKERA
ncbi:phosphotransferase [Altererythrobacter arenosus]|uniref:Phosphotransferase n=1 Tax=Altererythrobacter arenosus TaxID=3032592 RepID=A0ABY8FMV0_9SPHN|nr:phosphotransferase [Altererythrobacter sp. CAU 1644]WFL76102.1 phosphotransferase [Altererythrobacter sp. CAU 1644]